MRNLASILVLSALVASGCGRSDRSPPAPNPGPDDRPPVPAVVEAAPTQLRYHAAEPSAADGSDKGNDQSKPDDVASTPAAGGGLPDTKPGDDRKLVRSGRVDLVVASYAGARAKLDALVARLGGYVDATSVDRRQDTATDATIVVRLPAKAVPGLIPALAQIGDVVAESTSADDVTDQYVDVTARLASDQVLEKRLLELAADKGGTIDQVLAVERELARVREEIEGYQGRLRAWNDRIEMSTLTIALTTRRPEIASSAPTFGERAAATWDASIRALEDAATWLAVHGLASVPWLLLILPALVVLRRLARRIRLPFVIARRKPADATAVPAPAGSGQP